MPEPLYQQRRCLAIAVRELRVRRSLRQEEVQDKGGLSRAYLTGVESGRVSPSFDSLVRIADGLGVELSELIQLYEQRLRDS